MRVPSNKAPGSAAADGTAAPKPAEAKPAAKSPAPAPKAGWGPSAAGVSAPKSDGFSSAPARAAAPVATAVPAPATPAAMPPGTEALKDYDPNGFLASLGVPNDLGMSGRTDSDFLRAFDKSGYQPGMAYFPGPKWLGAAAQKLFLGLSKLSPDAGAVLARFASKVAITDSMHDPKLTPFGEKLDGPASGVAARDRYAGVVQSLIDDDAEHAFDANFHEGSIARVGQPGFGTYDLAKEMGFNQDQATRIARTDYDMDTNETPLKGPDGKPRHTESENGGDLQFHFNRAPKGQEDTRLTSARLHLDRAVELGKQGKYDVAEQELGIGLHSLQDVFAHGQLSPIGHTMLDDFPDMIEKRPETAREAQLATLGYLGKYLDGIGINGPPKFDPALGRPQAQALDPKTALSTLPAPLAQDVLAAGVRFVVTDEKVKPTDLGFGADPNHDGRIEAGAAPVDVDHDGKFEAYEQEGFRADGRAWNDIPAGYDANQKLVYVDRKALDAGQAPELLRHEAVHVLVDQLAGTPQGGAAIHRSWELAMERGEFDKGGPSEREWLTEALTDLDNAGLTQALDALRSGQPFKP